MKILQVNPLELRSISKEFESEYLVVESQVYGQDSDLYMHLVTRDEIALRIKERFLVREIQDKGRTPGLWQNLGGAGIFRPDAIQPGMFNPRIEAILKKKQPRPLFEGSTWKEILRNVPLPIDKKVRLGVYEHSLTAQA